MDVREKAIQEAQRNITSDQVTTRTIRDLQDQIRALTTMMQLVANQQLSLTKAIGLVKNGQDEMVKDVKLLLEPVEFTIPEKKV